MCWYGVIHSKRKLVSLTVIHVILVAVSQGLVTMPCSDIVCWLALCALALYASLGEVPYQHAVTTTDIRALIDCHHRQLEL